MSTCRGCQGSTESDKPSTIMLIDEEYLSETASGKMFTGIFRNWSVAKGER